MMRLLALACCILLPHPSKGAIIPNADVAGLVGDPIKLPCDVDRGKCGDLHSIKWYRGSSRIYVFSDMAGIARPEGEYAERAELTYDPNVTRTFLQLGRLTVADEAVYKCELTFLEVRDGCPVVQFVNLTALIKPEYVKITKGDGSEIQNSSLIGPFPEETKLELICESGGGKPLPAISWWNGTRIIHSTSEVESSGSSSKSRAKVSLALGRGDLGAKYECRVASPALTEQGGQAVAWVEIDVHVRPRKMELGGVEHHVVQGTEVTLRCHVTGARPAANVTWYNGTELIPIEKPLSDSSVQPPETKVLSSADGTYETQSRLSFRATRFENGGNIACEAVNPVIESKGEPPMRSSITLEVLYPPIVWVSPDNSTLNESSDVSIVCSFEANPPTPKSISWYRDGKALTIDGDRLEILETETFASSDSGPSPWGRSVLSLKNASRDDRGAYTCVSQNEVGSSESVNAAYVSVYFKPEVKLTMDPPTPVSELERLNITLLCKVEAGNPETLQAVRWYLDGELLKELPDCRGNASEVFSTYDLTFCDIDPSKLLLEVVGRSFHGNYSCEGMNEAGWGPLSQEEELIVHYPPGPASLTYDPSRVLKKSWVTLSCSVEDPGRPEAGPNSFKWFRGGHPIIDVTTANWTIEPVTLETQSNFTCLAANAGGEGESATVFVEVSAPPAFIERLPPYHGALMHAEYVSVSCRVECSPICQVRWLKNGKPLLEDGTQSSHYAIRTSILPPDPRTNDFESVVSTLLWNMTAWPNGKLDRVLDNANYTCESTANSVGPGVTSTTFFGVEYPPENITVSPQVVSVIEGQIPEKVVCNAKAYPEASYHWWRRKPTDSGNNVMIDPQTSSIVVKGNSLVLNYPIPRTDGGEYICEAYNRHGNATMKTYVNVLHKPECGITQTEVKGKLVLICRASANPEEVDFFWRIKNGSENETVEENVESVGPLSSVLTLETRVENFRTYLCFANNSVGMSIPCERDVTVSLSWWKKLENDNVLIIVAIIVGAVVMVIIVCIIIVIVCRRKRAEDKYNNPVEMEERENPEGASPQRPAQNILPRWPLRPGVRVHVNGAHTLGRPSPHPLAFSNHRHPSLSNFTQTNQNHIDVVRSSSLAGPTRDRVGVYLAGMVRVRDGTSRGLQGRCPGRRAGPQVGDTANSVPGIFHGKNGVVTFKKLDGENNHGTSRKRKKPGRDPNQSATKDKSKQSKTADGVGGSENDDDRAFYENLPFHGLQNPPNKQASPLQPSSPTPRVETPELPAPPLPIRSPIKKTATKALQPPNIDSYPLSQPAYPRPPSQSSRGGSSGYGSTRSSALKQKNSPWQSIRHLRLYNSMRIARENKTLRLPTKSLSWSKWNLRAGTLQRFRSRAVGHLAETPENREEKSTSETDNCNILTPLSKEVSERLKDFTPFTPVPAPRIGTILRSKHVYQNVPAPKTKTEVQENPTNPTSPFSISTGKQWQSSSNSIRSSNRDSSGMSRVIGRTGMEESSIMSPISPMPSYPSRPAPLQVLRPKPQRHHSREWAEGLHQSSRPSNSLTRNGLENSNSSYSCPEGSISLHTLPYPQKKSHHYSGRHYSHRALYDGNYPSDGITYADLSLRSNGYNGVDLSIANRSSGGGASRERTPTEMCRKQMPAILIFFRRLLSGIYFLPFHPEYTDLDYADVDYRSYGPINYKAASIDAATTKGMKKPPAIVPLAKKPSSNVISAKPTNNNVTAAPKGGEKGEGVEDKNGSTPSLL